MKKLLCIYPNDSSTAFLNKIVKNIESRLKNDFTCLRIEPNTTAHNKCLERLKNGNEESILFLGHGQSDRLFGAIQSRNRVLSDTSDFFFDNRDFITKDNIYVFSNKKVICLSCNSNLKLGKWAIDNNAKTFIGFGDIPTDWNKEYIKMGVSVHDINAFKNMISDIISYSLIFAINHKLNFDQIVKIIKLSTSKYLLDQESQYRIKNKNWINDSLYAFKDEITISGDKNLHFINND